MGVSEGTIRNARSGAQNYAPDEKRVGKDGKAYPASSKSKQKQRRTTKKTDTEPVQDYVRSAVQNDEAISREKVAKDFNVTEHTVTIARAREEGRQKAFAEINAISIEALRSASMKEKYTAAVRSMQKKLQHDFDVQFREAVRVEVQKQCDSAFPRLQEAQNETFREKELYRRYLAEAKKMFTNVEYELILMCCHEDNVASKTKRKEATQLLLLKRFALTGTDSLKKNHLKVVC
jgi:hypothetical protein